VRVTRATFSLVVTFLITASCADESQQANIDGERGGTGDPGEGPEGSSSASAAAHAWCKKNEWKLYKVFDGIKGVWVGAPDNIWIIVSHLHTGFYGNDPNGQIGVQSYVPFLAHWNGQDLCIAAANPMIPFGYEGGSIGGTANDLWLAVQGIDSMINPRSPIVHWDGVSWKAGPDDMYVSAFHVLGPSDFYAAGKKLHHWDGNVWTEVTSPDLGEMAGYQIWPDSQGRIWTLPGFGNDNQTCDVAVLSPAGSTWNGTCVLRKSAGRYMARLAGIDDQPWVGERDKSADYSLYADRVLRLEGDSLAEAFSRGTSVRCSSLYSAGERVVCIGEKTDYMWRRGEEEATTIVSPGARLDRNQKRDDLWAPTSSKVYRGTDGKDWDVVLSF
jgi:hypothetical protein